ncbi:MAG: glycosyltransferase family A protein [Steroidobacter sp.]
MSEIERSEALHGWRIYERLTYRPVAKKQKATDSYSFLIPHHNCATFLEVTIDSVRRHYADSPVVVVDSGSTRKEYMHAKAVCRRLNADLRPYVFRHGHTGQLNRLTGLAQTDKVIFLDQDCILLNAVDDLCKLLDQEFLLIGPQDRMMLSHPNFKHHFPQLVGTWLRDAAHYIHASFMMMRPKHVVSLYGRRPFSRHRSQPWLGTPLVVEPYYGLCDRLYKDNPRSMLYLEAVHSGYGLGMIYSYKGRPIAYHQWYSGRTHQLRGKIDVNLDVKWLDAERDRFIQDYWNGCVDFKLSS